MTEYFCRIGPVQIEAAHLYDENKYSVSSSVSKSIFSGSVLFHQGQPDFREGFSIICNTPQAFQIKGLVEIGEPVWIDASIDLPDNEYFKHKGWYLLSNVDFDHLSPVLIKCNIECTLISSNISEYITLDYTIGDSDGVALDYTYTPKPFQEEIIVAEDDMSSWPHKMWDPTVYTGPSREKYGYATIQSDGSSYIMSVTPIASSEASKAWIRTKTAYPVNVDINTSISFDHTQSVSRDTHNFGFALSPHIVDLYNDCSMNNVQWLYLERDIIFNEYQNYSTSSLKLIYRDHGKTKVLTDGVEFDENVTSIELRFKITSRHEFKIWYRTANTDKFSVLYEDIINMDVSNGLYYYLYAENASTIEYKFTWDFLRAYKIPLIDDDMEHWPKSQYWLNSPGWATNDQTGTPIQPKVAITSDGNKYNLSLESWKEGEYSMGWIRSQIKYNPPFQILTRIYRNKTQTTKKDWVIFWLGWGTESLNTGANTWTAAHWNDRFMQFAWNLNSPIDTTTDNDIEFEGWIDKQPNTGDKNYYDYKIVHLNSDVEYIDLLIRIEKDGHLDIVYDELHNGEYTYLYSGYTAMTEDMITDGLYLYLGMSSFTTDHYTFSLEFLELMEITQESVFDDDFKSLDTNIWDKKFYLYLDSNIDTSKIYSSTANYYTNITLQSFSDNTPICGWIRTNDKYTPPFTIITNFTLPSGQKLGANDYGIFIGLSSDIITNENGSTKKDITWLQLKWDVSPSNTIELSKIQNNIYSLGQKTSISSIPNALKIQLVINAEGQCLVTWSILGSSSGGTLKWLSPGIDFSKGVYLYMYIENYNILPFTGSFYEFGLYVGDATSDPNTFNHPIFIDQFKSFNPTLWSPLEWSAIESVNTNPLVEGGCDGNNLYATVTAAVENNDDQRCLGWFKSINKYAGDILLELYGTVNMATIGDDKSSRCLIFALSPNILPEKENALSKNGLTWLQVSIDTPWCVGPPFLFQSTLKIELWENNKYSKLYEQLLSPTLNIIYLKMHLSPEGNFNVKLSPEGDSIYSGKPFKYNPGVYFYLQAENKSIQPYTALFDSLTLTKSVLKEPVLIDEMSAWTTTGWWTGKFDSNNKIISCPSHTFNPTVYMDDHPRSEDTQEGDGYYYLGLASYEDIDEIDDEVAGWVKSLNPYKPPFVIVVRLVRPPECATGSTIFALSPNILNETEDSCLNFKDISWLECEWNGNDLTVTFLKNNNKKVLGNVQTEDDYITLTLTARQNLEEKTKKFSVSYIDGVTNKSIFTIEYPFNWDTDTLYLYLYTRTSSNKMLYAVYDYLDILGWKERELYSLKDDLNAWPNDNWDKGGTAGVFAATTQINKTIVGTCKSNNSQFLLTLPYRSYGTTKNYSGTWIKTASNYALPFTLEVGMTWTGTKEYGCEQTLILSPDILPESPETITRTNYIVYLLFMWNSTPKGGSAFMIRYDVDGNHQVILNRPLPAKTTHLQLKISISREAVLSVEYKGNNASWVKCPDVPIEINTANPLYAYLYQGRNGKAAWTAYYDYLHISPQTEAEIPNVVYAPMLNTLTPIPRDRFSKQGEYGPVPYYINPIRDITFQVDESQEENVYGSNVHLQVVTVQKDSNGEVLNESVYDVYDLDYKLKPSSSYDSVSEITTTVYIVLKNPFTKLKIGDNTLNTQINLYGYNHGWKFVNYLEYPQDISLIKPILIRHDEVVLQVNNTRIHLTKLAMFTIYHPQTILKFEGTEYYFHDGLLDTYETLETTKKGIVSMNNLLNGYYCGCYNASDSDSIFVVGKKDPCSINIDYLPAADITGIGWVTHTLDTHNRGEYMVLGWYSQTRTGFKFKQIV